MELRLASWGLAWLADDMTLIASELVTNAVVHGACGGRIRVRLRLEPASVLLAVWDPSERSPVRKRPLEAVLGDAAPDAEALSPEREDGTGGRGVPIVQALADECGVAPTADPVGKWVWARLSVASRRMPTGNQEERA
ncbi:ATP-binding protein [Actinomadura meyerae]|uniref:ATP-binding protein n=1 Tax=Actinomadura meyerae TaxID=240840 RepID=UPI0015C66900|nr:ATP-binding protein [Actinomadura meyerae]